MERARAEYGLTIMLGILIELSLTLVLSMVLKTVPYTMAIMISSLMLRAFTGGSHCSGYSRCILFTILYFIPASFLAKSLNLSCSTETIFILCVLMVLFVSAVIATKHNVYKLCVSVLGAIVVLVGILTTTKKALTGFALSVSLGLFLQALMLTRFGEEIMKKADRIMKELGF